MRQLLSLLALVLACAFALPARSMADNKGKIYKITFVGRGDSQTADQVTVENLTKGSHLTLSGQDTLYLLHPDVVAGCAPGLASGDRNPNRSYFDWNLCWYKYKIGNQVLPVVNYVVRP